jgi:cytochrome c biogenesis protein CcmG/thiol:disulfide interchange protein DsbE
MAVGLATGFIIGLGLILGSGSAPAESDYWTTLGIQQFKEKIPAPNFRLSDIEGKPLQLSDFQGKVVLLNFWATW